MTYIKPLTFPMIGDAVTLEVTVLSMPTNATTCGLYYILKTKDGTKCTEGNYQLTETEFAAWSTDNSYLDKLLADKFKLTVVAAPVIVEEIQPLTETVAPTPDPVKV